ncbi:MAG: hypothetical protein ABSE80_14070, partial [Halobacteriota archaeon]
PRSVDRPLSATVRSMGSLGEIAVWAEFRAGQPWQLADSCATANTVQNRTINRVPSPKQFKFRITPNGELCCV